LECMCTEVGVQCRPLDCWWNSDGGFQLELQKMLVKDLCYLSGNGICWGTVDILDTLKYLQDYSNINSQNRIILSIHYSPTVEMCTLNQGTSRLVSVWLWHREVCINS
jgi:hypothetical protein